MASTASIPPDLPFLRVLILDAEAVDALGARAGLSFGFVDPAVGVVNGTAGAAVALFAGVDGTGVAATGAMYPAGVPTGVAGTTPCMRVILLSDV